MTPAAPTPLDVALRLLECGISVLPLRLDGTKAPAVRTWEPWQTDRMTFGDAHFAFSRDVGIGIIAGRVSGNLEIADIEGHADIPAIVLLLEQMAPGLLDKLPRVLTPKGGWHLFWRCSIIEGNQKLAMTLVDSKPKTLIETRGEGGYVATISSPIRIHELLKPYTLIHGRLTEIPTITPEERDILLACLRSFNTYVKPEHMTTTARPSAPTGTGRPGDDFNGRGDILSILLKHRWTVSHRSGDTIYLRRPGKTKGGISASLHHVAPNVLYVFSTNAAPFDFERGYDAFGVFSILEYAGDTAAAAKALGAAGYGTREKPKKKEPAKRVQAEHIKNGSDPSDAPDPTPAQVAAAVDVLEKAAAPPPASKNGQARWLEWGLPCNGNGPFNNLDTAIGVLEHDPHHHDLLWHDDFLQKTMTTNGNGHAREWSDTDEINLALYMQRDLEIRRLGIETVSAACKVIAKRNRRHSVRDWLTALPVWDGVDRIDRFFEDHFGAEPTPYTARCSRNFWLMMIARVQIPGCQVDNMIVLEGSQGTYKSQALRAIAGEWFTQQHENVTSKAFFEVLQGKLMVEIGEMDAFTRADITRVKDIISCQVDRYREPYERRAQDHPRQCIFVGTTNRDDWNKDETGARRFWPIRCQGMIDIDAITAAREQLFAEALAIFSRVPSNAPASVRVAVDAAWWTTEATTEAKQAERLQEDPWQEPIEQYISHEFINDAWFIRSSPLVQLRMMELLQDVLHIELPRITRVDQLRVSAILTALGWQKVQTRIDGTVRKVWRPKNYTEARLWEE